MFHFTYFFRNPRVPMDVFKRKMEGRNLIKISRLTSKMGMSDLQKDNWVTIGVVVHKTEPRQSAAVSSCIIADSSKIKVVASDKAIS